MVECKNCNIYNISVNGILAFYAQVSIFAPVQEVKLANFKSCAKRQVVKLQYRVVQVSTNANLWRKIIISNSRDLECQKVPRQRYF